jgi:hypothetical protein
MNQGSSRTRLWWLIGIHVLLATTPLTTVLLPPHAYWSWLRVALLGISNAPWMLLVFWCGMGTTRPMWRCVGGVAGVAFLSAIPVVREALAHAALRWGFGIYHGLIPPMEIPVKFYATFYVWEFLTWTLSLEVMVPLLLVFRYRIAALQPTSEAAGEVRRWQFRIAHLLALTLFVAINLGLVRLFCFESGVLEGMLTWRWFRFQAASFAILVIIMWATLFPGPVSRRMAAAFLFGVLPIALLDGIAIGVFRNSWSATAMLQQFLAWSQLWWLPAAIFAASLLVVRSWGYRLMRPVGQAA